MGMENHDDFLVLIARNLACLADSTEKDQLKKKKLEKLFDKLVK